MHLVNRTKKNISSIKTGLFLTAIVFAGTFLPLQVTLHPAPTSSGGYHLSFGTQVALAAFLGGDKGECPEGQYWKFTEYNFVGSGTKGECVTGSPKGLLTVDPLQTLAEWLSDIIYFIMVGLFSTVAYIAAAFFSLAVQLTLNSAVYALNFITLGWQTARDIANMAFIFILIYIAFTIMLKAETANTMKMLAGVIIVALVINFSFFITRIVIDSGNVLAVQFYNQIPNKPLAQNNTTNNATWVTYLASGATSNLLGGETKDLTASIMGGLDVSQILNSKSFQEYQKSLGGSFWYTLTALSLIYIAVGIAFAILAGAFFFAGAKFVMRTVGLMFLIIASPLALVARATGIESAKKLFYLWQDWLLKLSFYPAIFLFMFLVLTKFMDGLGNNFISDIFIQAPGNNFIQEIGTAIAHVGIKLGFVIAMLYVALSASEFVVRQGSGAARTFQRWGLSGLTGGLVGGLGRGTLGFGGRGVAQVQRWRGREEGATARTAAWLGGRTYDPRNIPVVGRGLQRIVGPFAPATRVPAAHGGLPVDFGGPAQGQAGPGWQAASPAIQSAEKAIKGKALSDRDIERIRTLNKQQLEKFGKDVTKLAPHLSEKQIGEVNELERLSDKDKDDASNEWHSKSKLAPLEKSMRVVHDDLRTIHADLKGKGVPLPMMEGHIQSGSRMNAKRISEMSDEIKRAITTENFKKDDTSLSKTARTDAGVNVLTLRDARAHIKDLQTESAKVPDKIGGGGKGEFVVT